MLDLITDGYEPPCGGWELKSGLLEEQAVFLNTEPSLQPHEKCVAQADLELLILWPLPPSSNPTSTWHHNRLPTCMPSSNSQCSLSSVPQNTIPNLPLERDYRERPLELGDIRGHDVET